MENHTKQVKVMPYYDAPRLQQRTLLADALLVTATDTETRVVFDVLAEQCSRVAARCEIDSGIYYDLGVIGSVRTFLVRSEMGSGGPSGSLLTIDDAIRALSPSIVVMVGIAFGADKLKQVLGDILISELLVAYEMQRIGTGVDGMPTIVPRGFRVPAPPQLLSRFRAAARTWSGPRVRFGTILSGEKLIDNRAFRDELLVREPEAIGGEMEGAGLYAAAQRRRVDWMLVKAISDWADGSKGEDEHHHQTIAAQHAVRFTFYVLQHGQLEVSRESIGVDPRQQATRIGSRAAIYDLAVKPWPAGLPAQTTALVGRAQAIKDLIGLLRDDDARLITLTGPGGVGKTRLGIEVAATASTLFPDGVHMVELAAIGDPELVTATIAQKLGVREAGGCSLDERLVDYLRSRRAMLLLDNFEHLIAAAMRVMELLAACPGLTVLVTSRLVLQLSAEYEFEVLPLAYPDLRQLRQTGQELLTVAAESDAVQLFVKRMRMVQTGFSLTERNVHAVAEICLRLDGLPLAIELAAARGRLFAPPAMLARLADRFELLASGARDRPARHQSLRGAIDWSYELLDPPEQVLFRRLGVFIGGCTLDAAVDLLAVAEQAVQRSSDPAALDLLTSLVNSSMVHRNETPDGEPRFFLLETIREYALEQLAQAGELEGLRQFHAQRFLALASRAGPMLRGAQQQIWLDRLDQERENLWFSLTWFLEHEQVHDGLQLVNALHNFWIARGYFSDGRMWVERLLAGAREHTAIYAQALHGAGDLAYHQGDYALADMRYQESLALCQELQDSAGVARALASLGELARDQGDYARALRLAEGSEQLYRALGDRYGLAFALNVLGAAARNSGDFARARALTEESLTLYRELGDQLGVAWSLYRLGIVAFYQNDSALERACYEESLAIRRAIGDKWGMAYSLNNLGLVAVGRGEYTLAQAYHEESRALYQELGDRTGIAMALLNLGEMARSRSDSSRAEMYCEAALEIYQEIGNPQGLAITLHNLAHVAHQQRLLDRAAALFLQGLELCHEKADWQGIAMALAGFAGVAETHGQFERAARLLGAVDWLLRTTSRRFYAPDQVAYSRTIEAVHERLGAERFAAAWNEGQMLTMEQAIAYASDQETESTIMSLIRSTS